MIITSFLLGYGILTGLSHFGSYRVKKWDSYVFCGLAAATVYAQFFSIFAPVGLAANLLLLAVCLAVAFLAEKDCGRILDSFAGSGEIFFQKEQPGSCWHRFCFFYCMLTGLREGFCIMIRRYIMRRASAG